LQELRFLPLPDVGVFMAEPELPVPVRLGAFPAIEQCAALQMLGVQRGTAEGRVQHELMKLRVVSHGVLDGRVDVLRHVFLEPDDR
jgi:hypothetical protein